MVTGDDKTKLLMSVNGVIWIYNFAGIYVKGC